MNEHAKINARSGKRLVSMIKVDDSILGMMYEYVCIFRVFMYLPTYLDRYSKYCTYTTHRVKLHFVEFI